MPITVTRINTTPIKGTALQHPESVTLEASGVFANRRFYLIDEDGVMTNGKRIGALVRIHASYDDDERRLEIRLPDDVRVAGAIQLSNQEVVTSFYGRPVQGLLVEGPWNDAISGLVGKKIRLVYASPDTIAVDRHPVTLISRATLDDMRTRAGGPAERWDDRFRMMFELDGMQACEEDAWAGRRLAIGDAIVRVIGPVPRCVVTTHDPATGDGNFETLKALLRIRGEDRRKPGAAVNHLPDGGRLLLGMYASVEQNGRAWRGCPVETLE